MHQHVDTACGKRVINAGHCVVLVRNANTEAMLHDDIEAKVFFIGQKICIFWSPLKRYRKRGLI